MTRHISTFALDFNSKDVVTEAEAALIVPPV
jgi:hypothetical protein